MIASRGSLLPRPFLYGRGEEGRRLPSPLSIQEGLGTKLSPRVASLYISVLWYCRELMSTMLSPLEWLPQGVVTNNCADCQNFGQWKLCLIGWLFSLKLLMAWFTVLQGHNGHASLVSLICWFLQFGGHLDPLIGSKKLCWSLDFILILVTNASTGDIP